MMHIRRAGPLDSPDMATLLNEIIAIGGTTAMTMPLTRDTMANWMQQEADLSAWHVAEDETGRILGFQLISPHPDLPPDACDIATFVRAGRTGQRIGSRLFEASADAARALGYRWINATIRADNAGGLAYYQSRGFETYVNHACVRLDNGEMVDRISKRYGL